MNGHCERWQALLDGFLAGRLDAADRTFVLGHADGCESCRDLLKLVSADLPELGDPDGLQAADLTGAVLAATTGPACARAEILLAERPDGTLKERDAALLDDHLDHCDACQELAPTLTWVMPAVAGLAGPELDPGLSYDLLRPTAAARAPHRARPPVLPGHPPRALA
nr:zf-HC2 domain-containing protein [bacterium]